ncbi:hypothetical protein B0H67DRAFT_575065 [Lasiosphaeris hirsuta]|uniref:PARP catalytic domain-containing protein n=1 Tax=Lasiosphaeris hirsuta TaxID=260670 RepID=A0AA40E2D3_9PEZI|nr:hypothetical protein B0H67DRAFT_575065 [Lasiosphaeris hirsuta]
MDPEPIVRGGLPLEVLEWTHSDVESGFLWRFVFSMTELRLYTDIFEQPLLCELHDTYHTISRKVIDPLREALRQHFLHHGSEGTDGRVRLKRSELSILILCGLETVIGAEREQTKRDLATGGGKCRGSKNGWNASQVSEWDVLLNHPAGLDPSTIVDTAYNILGRTPEQIHAAIPSSWRVIHIESIMRSDVAQRFLHYQSTLRASLIDEQATTNELRRKLPPHSTLEGRVRATLARNEIIDDMVKPCVTFHGTALSNVASIIQHGFKMPGKLVDGNLVASPRSGVAYNRGIYSSQAAFYALSYASGQRQLTPLGEVPSMRLFVCATVMGRTLRPDSVRGADAPAAAAAVHGPLVAGYDAHFDGKFEYIAHHEQAMLPCYVVHLDLGSEEAKRALTRARDNPGFFGAQKGNSGNDPRIPTEPALGPGDVRREKEAKKAAAMKWFPYGFGGATGTNFVVQEVGAISDDEEEYGDWQDERHGYVRRETRDANVDVGVGESEYYDDFDEDGNPIRKKRGVFLDQYQGARNA